MQGIQNNTLKTIENKAEILFKIFFFIYTLLGFCSITYGNALISITMWASAAVGIVVLALRFFNIKKYMRFPAFFAMILFIVACVLSVIVNSYSLKANIILIAYISVYFFILYLPGETGVKKEIKLFSAIFTIYTTVAIIVSFMLMHLGITAVKTVGDDNYKVITGFSEGRLWGIFLDPNVGAAMAAASIFMLLYFSFKFKIHSFKSVFFKIIIWANIFLHLIFITFTDSRSAAFCIILASFAFTVKTKSRIKSAISAFFCVLLALMFIYCFKVIYNKAIYRASNNKQNIQTEQMGKIEREYDLSKDYSNRRFSLWKSGFEVFSKSIIFGTTYHGIRAFAHEHTPDTYLINNSQTEFANFHNELINILCAQGLLGFISVIYIILSILLFTVPRIKKVPFNYEKEINLCAAVVIIFAAASLFRSGVFYLLAPSTVIFWLFLGYGVKITESGIS